MVVVVFGPSLIAFASKPNVGRFPLEPCFRREIPRLSPILGHFKLSGRQFDDPKNQEKPKKTKKYLKLTKNTLNDPR